MIETVGGSEPGYERVEAQLAAEGAELAERERAVLRLRFEEDLTQYEIGGRLGVSQMQVSRIMRRRFASSSRRCRETRRQTGPEFSSRAIG